MGGTVKVSQKLKLGMIVLCAAAAFGCTKNDDRTAGTPNSPVTPNEGPDSDLLNLHSKADCPNLTGFYVERNSQMPGRYRFDMRADGERVIYRLGEGAIDLIADGHYQRLDDSFGYRAICQRGTFKARFYRSGALETETDFRPYTRRGDVRQVLKVQGQRPQEKHWLRVRGDGRVLR